jgi:hypothetical protein
MAAGPLTQVSDVVVPEIFTPYVQQMTEEKARLVQSGVLARDALLDQLLQGGGLTFNVPSWRDLDSDADNVSTDDVADIIAASFSGGTPATRLDSTPLKIETDTEIAVRLNRNQSWSSADLAAALAGDDPMNAIARGVAFYWTRRLQAVFIATWNGVIKDNVANDSGDYQNDISGGAFIDGVTNFSAEAFLDAKVTMGDSMEKLTAIMVHSVVYNRMQKNNLIDFIPDARGEVQIPTFLGAEVIVDDGMPNAANVYDTWLFGAGATRLGVASPRVPTEVDREPQAGNGGGQEILFSRVQWCMHPIEHAYTGTAPDGGPGNGTGASELNNAGSWNRVYPERKQIAFARLVTREA